MALFPPCRAQFKGMHCFWGSYLIVTLHLYSPLPSSGGSQRMETKQWGQIDLERELPTRPLNFCYPQAPSSLVYLSKPPRWSMDHSNPKLPLHLLPSSPSFICLHYFSCMWRKRSNLSDSRDPKDELKEGNGRLDKNTKGRLSSLPLLSSVSRHLKSHLGFISSGFYAWAAWWCANKERKGVREREWESKNVLIKGNSEGLYQIKLHNVVREDTAFDTEKMKLTCPQMAMVWSESVTSSLQPQASWCFSLESCMFTYSEECGPVRLTVETDTSDSDRLEALNPTGGDMKWYWI